LLPDSTVVRAYIQKEIRAKQTNREIQSRAQDLTERDLSPLVDALTAGKIYRSECEKAIATAIDRK
jgi:hypothetical protein